MRILIAEEQALFRDALRALLEERGHEVVAEADDCADAVRSAQTHRPAVALIGACEPVAALASTTREIIRASPETAVIVVADHADDLLLFRAMGAGAKGYLTKELDGDHFCELLTRVERGGPALTPQSASRLLRAFLDTSPPARAKRDTPLTEREHEVLDTMAQGVTSNKGLASALHVSENTVRFHVRHILEKLHLHTRAAAIAFALTHGLVDGNEEGEADG